MSSAQPPPRFLCLVTNAGYAPGAVCLAQSLALVGSAARLVVIATSPSAEAALLAEAEKCPGGRASCPMDVVLEEHALPPADTSNGGGKTHGSKGAVLAVDAPRRSLFDDGREGWILLDADLLAVQSPDGLFRLLGEREPTAAADAGPPSASASVSASVSASALAAASAASETPGATPAGAPPQALPVTPVALHAVGNFRVKKQAFGTAAAGNNFNAGVMVVPSPASTDGRDLSALVEAAAASGDVDATEELLMNELFKGRWASIPRGYNVPKRVLHHAPAVWREMVERGEVVFLHYMGAKPWMTCPERRRGADWVCDRRRLGTLHRWRHI